MKYRLLIVDNESFVVDGLMDLFGSSEHLELYGAESADEAISWLNRARIDIVLSDIQMPGMTGLELQEIILRQWPLCKVIFLTGYHEIEYFQEAMRNESLDFVLKSEGDERILQSVDRAVKLLEKEWNMKHQLSAAQQQAHRALPMLRQSFLEEVVNGYIRDPRHIREKAAELMFPLPERPFYLVLARVDDWGTSLGYSDRARYRFALQNISEEFFSSMLSTFSCFLDENKMIWILQSRDPETPDPDSSARSIRFIQGMLEQIQETCRSYYRMKISFVASSRECVWDRLEEQFKEMRLQLSHGLGLGEELLLTEAVSPKTASASFQLLRAKVNRSHHLRALLDEGKSEEFEHVFAEMKKNLDDVPLELALELRAEIFYSLVAVFLPFAHELAKEAGSDSPIDLDRLTRIQAHDSWDSALGYFHTLAKAVLANKNAGYEKKGNEIIDKIKRYVADNIHGDLSLPALGEVVMLNQSYLSRLFKQVAGENLSEFIAEARLAKAKQLLRSSQMRINDISAAVGFLSDGHFYRVFKKAMNMTPHEYRENYQ